MIYILNSFPTLLYVGQKHNAKYFGPGELCSNAAKYKPLKQSTEGKLKALFMMGETVRVETWHSERTRETQEIELSERKKEETKTQEEDLERLKDGARGRGGGGCPMPFGLLLADPSSFAAVR